MDELKQNLLFDEKDLEFCQQNWTQEELNILNADFETQLEYIKNFFLSNNCTYDNFQIFETLQYPRIITTLLEKRPLTVLQIKLLLAPQDVKKGYAINYFSQGETVDFICSLLFCKKSVVYKWLKENRELVLERKIFHLENKLEEYKNLGCFPSKENYIDQVERYIDLATGKLKDDAPEKIDFKNDSVSEFFTSESFRQFILDQHKNEENYIESQEKQFIKYTKELEKTKLELQRYKQEENKPESTESKEICKTASTIPNDIVLNDFYDLLTYYDDLELYAKRQNEKSHSLQLTVKNSDSKIKLNLIKTNTKNLTLQMDNPANVNMKFMRDLFVIAIKQLAELNKDQMTPENLRLNPIILNISINDYYKNSNYESLRKLQEMSKDENIQFLGSLAIMGKSKIYDGKGRSKTEVFASESKKFIPMFKSVGYQNNNIELVLNDVFPWKLFTLKYFTMIPDNYCKLSENAKTLLMHLVSQARIKKESTYKIYYSTLQILLNLKSYEDDKKHASERIIQPIQKTIEEVNEKNAYFICIDEEKDANRTPKEILENGYITVTCKNDIKELIDNVNSKKQNRIKKATQRKKKSAEN